MKISEAILAVVTLMISAFLAIPTGAQQFSTDGSGNLYFAKNSLNLTSQHPCHYRHDGPALLPDPHCTPGAIIKSENPCAASFRTGEVRNVPESVKRKVYAEYGTAEKRGTCCEIDHLISLEIQGSNDIENLWPEPYLPLPGAHQKDVLENALHKEACSGTITLQQAQREISTDWYAAYTSLEAKGKLK